MLNIHFVISMLSYKTENSGPGYVLEVKLGKIEAPVVLGIRLQTLKFSFDCWSMYSAAAFSILSFFCSSLPKKAFLMLLRMDHRFNHTMTVWAHSHRYTWRCANSCVKSDVWSIIGTKPLDDDDLYHPCYDLRLLRYSRNWFYCSVFLQVGFLFL